MYGWLSYSPEAGVIASFPSYGSPGDVGADPQLIMGRKTLLQTFIKKELAADSPDVQKRISLTLERIIGALNKDAGENLEFHLYMGMAHERLPEASRRARQALIDRAIATCLAQTTDHSDAVQSKVSRLRQVAILWPESRIVELIRTSCGQIMSDMVLKLMGSGDLVKGGQAFPHLWGGLFEFLHEQETREVPVTGGLPAWFISTMLTRAPAECDETQSSFMQTLKNLDIGFLPKIINKLLPLRSAMDMCVIYDILVRIMKDKLANPASLDEDIFDTHVAWAEGQLRMQNTQTLFASIAAVSANVPMGAKTESSKVALASLRQAVNAANQAMTPKLAEMARRFRKSPTASQPGQEKVDLDQPHSWSVPKLLRWIEGPVTRPAQSPIDRAKILATENAAAGRQPPAPSAKGKTEPAPPAITPKEADIDGTIQDALSATAAFFFGEIQDMLTLARKLGTDNPLTQACADLISPLDILANKPMGPEDELKARAVLTTAEKATTDLRHSLKTAQAALQVQRRFQVQLVAALMNEPLAWGKRHGGKIACAVHPTDWSYIVDNFHNRWLPQVKSVTIGKLNTPLDEDQAAALYITGSSLSGYAFDVSVHIWQRYPGKTSLPSEKSDAFPAMNTEDWFDSYVPCCVLHVPAA